MVRASDGVGVWKELRKGWELVVGKMVFVVGNGSRVLSWKDKWCRSMACVMLSSICLLLLLTKTL